MKNGLVMVMVVMSYVLYYVQYLRLGESYVPPNVVCSHVRSQRSFIFSFSLEENVDS